MIIDMTYKNDDMVTAERVLELMSETGMSQTRYAAMLQVSQPTVSDKLAGTVRFTARDIRRTAIGFGVSTDYLYGLTARVTDSEPANGELVGLTILNIDTGHPKVDHAIFKPLKPTTHWDERLTGGITKEDAGIHLPFSFYQPEIQHMMDQAEGFEGPNIVRDLGFLQAQGIRLPVTAWIRQTEQEPRRRRTRHN